MTPIYHITHMDNLRGILDAGELICDRIRMATGVAVVGIAHQHIKNRRARRPVPTASGGTLADYVPFYFAPRSPMLFSISRNQVDGYTGGQEGVVHLVSSAETAAGLPAPWCFTNGHAEMALSTFFNDLADLSEIDWGIMRSRYWNDTNQEMDRKRKRQAEFLVYGRFPWTAIEEIGVMDAGAAQQVGALLGGHAHRPRVAVRRNWYY